MQCSGAACRRRTSYHPGWVHAEGAFTHYSSPPLPLFAGVRGRRILGSSYPRFCNSIRIGPGRGSFCAIYGEEEHEERGDKVVGHRASWVVVVAVLVGLLLGGVLDHVGRAVFSGD